jgi:hypothetical protein
MPHAVLEGRGRKRRVVVSTQHFMLVPEVVAQTDIVAMMPSRLVNSRSARLRIVEPLFRLVDPARGAHRRLPRPDQMRRSPMRTSASASLANRPPFAAISSEVGKPDSPVQRRSAHERLRACIGDWRGSGKLDAAREMHYLESYSWVQG